MYEYTDTNLIIKIRKGCEKSFREIYDKYHIQMYYIAKKYVKNSRLAEDAVQDIFLRLWETRDNLDEMKSIKGFLFTMLRNHVLNMIRDRKKEIISISSVNENQLPWEDLVTDEEIVYNEYYEIVERGLKELSDRKRQVFELKTVEGYSNSEVAKILNINTQTVKNHFYNGSKFMRTYLKNHAGILSALAVISISAILVI